jgi:hypothetical protein
MHSCVPVHALLKQVVTLVITFASASQVAYAAVCRHRLQEAKPEVDPEELRSKLHE